MGSSVVHGIRHSVSDIYLTFCGLFLALIVWPGLELLYTLEKAERKQVDMNETSVRLVIKRL